ncbi:hypothetical protein KEJ39_00790 [Candidatus Bathyarchaeota archaeon]|nr:hypothetical protein [Candidatus Bathyarchaeota archaeon]
MRHTSTFMLVILFLSLNITLTTAATTPNDILVQGTVWTYHASTKDELQGTGRYEGNFTTLIIVSGRATITNLSSSFLTVEKREEIDLSVSGSGYYKQEMRSEHYRFTTKSTIDRNAFTYMSRRVKDEVNDRESEDNSTRGMPATEFISTSLMEGQRVSYYAIDGKVACSVSYGEMPFQSASIPVIVLSYSGYSGRDVWLETNGTAEHSFAFERTTGLLVSALSSVHTTSEKGTRSTTYSYALDSTSLWVAGQSVESTQTQTLPPEMPEATTSPSQAVTDGSTTEHTISILVAFGIAAVASYALLRKKAVANDLDRLTKKKGGSSGLLRPSLGCRSPSLQVI